MAHTSLVIIDDKERGTNPMLGRMMGIGGDYCILANSTPTSGLLFTHIVITAAATITDIKIGGVSKKTARNYGGTLPAGYLICAGGLNESDQIDYIKLGSGSAEGIIFEV